MLFYYLTANTTRDVFHNSGPVASLRLKNTWGGALISVDLYKITLFYILFLSFYNGHIFGGLINGATFVLIIWWAYIRGFDLIFQAFSKIVLGQFLDKKKVLKEKSIAKFQS